MKKIVLITPKEYPVPAVKGGAVETLMTNLIEENEEQKRVKLYMVSVYNKEAEEESKKYKQTQFIYIKMKFHYKLEKIRQRLNLHYEEKCVKNKLTKVMYLLCRKTLSFGLAICNQIYNYKAFCKIKKIPLDYIIIEAGLIEKYKNYIKKYPKEKCLLHLHGEFPANIDNTIYYNNFLAISQYIKDKFLDNDLVSSNQIKVLPNCVKRNDFCKKITEKEKIRIKNELKIKETNIVIFCGRLIEEKGVRELIQAFKNIKNLEDTKLLIIGNSQFGNDAKTQYELQIQKEAEDIKAKVGFLGYIHNKKLSELYKIADIAVFPAIWEEPSGLVILEAMNAGLPIITTNSGGIPELVNNKCAIILNKEKNLVENLSKQIDFLIENPEIRKKMGQEGKQLSNKFNEKEYYENFVRIIENIDKGE